MTDKISKLSYAFTKASTTISSTACKDINMTAYQLKKLAQRVGALSIERIHISTYLYFWVCVDCSVEISTSCKHLVDGKI